MLVNEKNIINICNILVNNNKDKIKSCTPTYISNEKIIVNLIAFSGGESDVEILKGCLELALVEFDQSSERIVDVEVFYAE